MGAFGSEIDSAGNGDATEAFKMVGVVGTLGGADFGGADDTAAAGGRIVETSSEAEEVGGKRQGPGEADPRWASTKAKRLD